MCACVVWCAYVCCVSCVHIGLAFMYDVHVVYTCTVCMCTCVYVCVVCIMYVLLCVRVGVHVCIVGVHTCSVRGMCMRVRCV